MSRLLGTITIDLAPSFHVGPIEIAWHGLTIAIGIVAGGLLAGRWAKRRGLDTDPLSMIGILLTVSALIGGRVFYLAEHGMLGDPGRWFGTTGFTFDGGFIAAAIAIVVYVRRTRLSLEYLDIVAAALPLGIAIGRIGDIINGEHYGAPTTFFLGVVNANPDSLTPRHDIAYHNGGMYEVLLAAAIFAIVAPLRHRLRPHVTAMMWLVIALFSVGRFFEFFLRSDSEELALGLSSAQWTSVVLLVVAGVGAWWTLLRRGAPRSAAGAGAGP